MNSLPAPGVAQLIDYFLHPALTLESDLHHRARILIASLLFFAVMMIATAVALTLTSFAMAPKIVALGICILLTLGCVLGLFALRRSGRFILCSMSAVVVDMLAITAGILLEGSGAASPVIQLLAMPAVLGYFFGGVRWGSMIAMVALLEILLFVALAAAGVHFASTVEADKAGDAQLVIGIIGFVAISAIAFIYEYTAGMLKRERDFEHARVNRLARVDALTGVSNRHGFDAELSVRVTDNAARAQRCFALCCLDLDGFKPINDQHGHDVGDEVLRAISARLQKALRNSDCVGRHGGDEFLLLLDGLREEGRLHVVAQRLLRQVAEPIATSVGVLRVMGSFGFAIFPDHATDVEALKRAADSAMYIAKRDGSGWCLYSSDHPSAIS